MGSECGDPGSRDKSCLVAFGLGVVLVVGTSDEGGSCFWTGGKRLAPGVGVDGRCKIGSGRQRERATLQISLSAVFITVTSGFG
jgi:hypothetical protein